MLPRILRTLTLAAFIISSLVFILPSVALAQPESGACGSQTASTPAQRSSPEITKPDEPKKPEQAQGEDENRSRDPMSTPTFNGLRFRSLGPAFTSGRVIGFAVDPNNAAKYFVASA